MNKKEQFVDGEDEWETPKQSPGSNQTWPMDKIRQRRFQQKMSSLLLSPVTPKRNYSASHAKSLLLQCLRDSKSDPLPRKRFLASYSDDGILMDGVLVTSATGKKVSGSPSSSLGRSARSSIIRSQHKNAEFSTPRSKSGPNQETTQSQHSSAGKRKMLEDSPSTKLDTPKVAHPSNLQATAEPFIFTPRSSPRLASPVPLQRFPHDHDPHFQWGSPSPHQDLSSSYGHQYLPLSYAYPRPPPLYLHPPASPHGPDLYHTHYLSHSPRPTGYQMPHDFNQSPTITSLPKTPSSSQPNTNTSEPPAQTPISTNPTENLSTNTTMHGSRLDLPSFVVRLNTVTPKTDLSLPSDELEAMTQKPHLSPPFYAGLQTMTAKKDWSPCDDRLEIFSQAQSDFVNSHGRILPDDVFEHYKYRMRLPVFIEICLDDKLPLPKPQET